MLAEMLADTATNQTDSTEARRYTEAELKIRKKLVGKHPDARVRLDPSWPEFGGINDWLKLAGAYERAADLPGDISASVAYLRNAVAALDPLLKDHPSPSTFWPLPEDQVLALSSYLAHLEAKLAKALTQDGNLDEAVQWAQKSARSAEQAAKIAPNHGDRKAEPSLVASYRDLGDVLAAAGQVTEASKYYNRACDILKPSIKPYEDYRSEDKYRPDGPAELDLLWEKLIRDSLNRSNANSALITATEACAYWKELGRHYGINNLGEAHLAAAWLRHGNICEMDGRKDEAGRSISEATKIQDEFQQAVPGLLVTLAEILARRLSLCNQTNRPDPLGERYIKQALSALRAASETPLLFPENLPASVSLKPLASRPEFVDTVRTWAARDQGQKPPGLESGIVSVRDQKLIRSASANQKEITLQGLISSAKWIGVGAGRQLHLNFDGVLRKDLTAILQEYQRFEIQSKLASLTGRALAAGDLEGLLKGALFEFKGTPGAFNGRIHLFLTSPEQIVHLTPASERGSALSEGSSVARAAGDSNLGFARSVSPAMPPGVIHVGDESALEHATGKEITAQGLIDTAKWSASGNVMSIEFADAVEGGVYAVVFKKDGTNIAAAVGGDPEKVLPGKSVRVSGKLVMYQGRPEIIITNASQIVFIGDGATGTPAISSLEQVTNSPAATNETPHQPSAAPGTLRASDSEAIKSAVHKNVRLEGTVQSAEWSPSGAVMSIQFKDAGDQGLFAVIFKKDAESIKAGIGGDAAEILVGKSVQLLGNLTIYRGRPQIIVTNASQIILTSGATNAAAKTASQQ